MDILLRVGKNNCEKPEVSRMWQQACIQFPNKVVPENEVKMFASIVTIAMSQVSSKYNKAWTNQHIGEYIGELWQSGS